MKRRLFSFALTCMTLLLTQSVHGQNYEWTSKVKNPSFESGSTKWTLTKNVSGWEDFKIVSGEAPDGNRHYNLWAQKVTNINLSQNIVLPAGNYILSAQLRTNKQGIGDQHVYVASSVGTANSPTLTASDGLTWKKLSVSFTLTKEETITIGACGTGSGINEKGWFCVDDFRLYGDTEPEADINQSMAQVTNSITLTGTSELRITGSTPFSSEGRVNLPAGGHTVVLLDSLRPSETQQWLSHVTIDGQMAVSGENCQLRLYDHGTLLYPYGKEGRGDGDFHPLTVYSEQNCQGESYDRFGTENTHGFMNTLTNEMMNNRIRSFRLRRGYMVTFALGEAGWGYQRCFIADDEDLVVNMLPDIMDRRISSYRVFRWDNLGKNGVANILNTNNLEKLNATWTYAWNAGRDLGSDYECVPHMVNLHETKVYDLGVNDLSANLKTDNEPANGNDPYPSSVAEELQRWPQLMRTGRRLVSPSSFDSGEWWHKQFFDSIDARGWRCDVVDIHCYWSEGNFNNIRKNWADKFHRPVWITEFIWGASWSGGFGIFDVARGSERGNPSAATLEKNREVCARIWDNLNGQDCVERYAYWNDEWPCSKILWNGNLTPAGEEFAKMKTGVGYNGTYDFVPTEWRCQAATGMLATYNGERRACVVTWQSPDCDLAETITLQRRIGNGEWQDIKTWERPDHVDYSYDDPINDETVQMSYRVVERTWKNVTKTSGAVTMSRYLINGSIMAESKSSIQGWTCVRNAANGFTKDNSGDTYLEVWNSTPTSIDFDYYQNVENLPAGVYQLKAVCFNSTNGVSGATVNGHVGIYAVADGVSYFQPVTIDSEIDYTRPLTIETIVVRGGKMRLGFRNVGEMTARWAGADNFELTYLGTEEEVLPSGMPNISVLEESLVAAFPDNGDDTRDASGLIFNTDCLRGNTTFWQTKNVGITKGQAWDGDAANQYFDKWQSGALNSSMEQTLTILPAGDYTLSALLRGTTDIDITLKATINKADGTTQHYSKTIKGIDSNTIDGSDYQRGWQKVSTDQFTIETGDQLTIAANGTAQKTAWWSADHFQLTFGTPSMTGIVTINNEPHAVNQCYDLQGRLLPNGPMKRGLYIVDRKKIFIK